jgi:hypothetical protein
MPTNVSLKKRREQGEVPAHRPEQNVHDHRQRDVARAGEHFTRQTDAKQHLGPQDVVGGRAGVARHDEAAPGEGLPEEGDNDDEKVEHPADACVGLRRGFRRSTCHFMGSSIAKVSARVAIRGSDVHAVDSSRIWGSPGPGNPTVERFVPRRPHRA